MFIGNNNSGSKLRVGALVRIPSPVIRVSTKTGVTCFSWNGLGTYDIARIEYDSSKLRPGCGRNQGLGLHFWQRMDYERDTLQRASRIGSRMAWFPVRLKGRTRRAASKIVNADRVVATAPMLFPSDSADAASQIVRQDRSDRLSHTRRVANVPTSSHRVVESGGPFIGPQTKSSRYDHKRVRLPPFILHCGPSQPP